MSPTPPDPTMELSLLRFDPSQSAADHVSRFDKLVSLAYPNASESRKWSLFARTLVPPVLSPPSPPTMASSGMSGMPFFKGHRRQASSNVTDPTSGHQETPIQWLHQVERSQDIPFDRLRDLFIDRWTALEERSPRHKHEKSSASKRRSKSQPPPSWASSRPNSVISMDSIRANTGYESSARADSDGTSTITATSAVVPARSTISSRTHTSYRTDTNTGSEAMKIGLSILEPRDGTGSNRIILQFPDPKPRRRGKTISRRSSPPVPASTFAPPVPLRPQSTPFANTPFVPPPAPQPPTSSPPKRFASPPPMLKSVRDIGHVSRQGQGVQGEGKVIVPTVRPIAVRPTSIKVPSPVKIPPRPTVEEVEDVSDLDLREAKSKIGSPKASTTILEAVTPLFLDASGKEELFAGSAAEKEVCDKRGQEQAQRELKAKQEAEEEQRKADERRALEAKLAEEQEKEQKRKVEEQALLKAKRREEEERQKERNAAEERAREERLRAEKLREDQRLREEQRLKEENMRAERARQERLKEEVLREEKLREERIHEEKQRQDREERQWQERVREEKRKEQKMKEEQLRLEKLRGEVKKMKEEKAREDQLRREKEVKEREQKLKLEKEARDMEEKLRLGKEERERQSKLRFEKEGKEREEKLQEEMQERDRAEKEEQARQEKLREETRLAAETLEAQPREQQLKEAEEEAKKTRSPPPPPAPPLPTAHTSPPKTSDIHFQPLSYLPLAGKTIAITGANHGIGRATAIALARLGANIVAHYFGTLASPSNPSIVSLCTTIRSLPAGSGAITIVYGDIADPRTGESIVRRAVDVFGRLDGAVGNAGMLWERGFLEVTPEVLRRHVDVNANGMFFFLQACVRRMVLQWHAIPTDPRPARMPDYPLVVISDSVALTGAPCGQIHYASSKAAVCSMVKGLAAEYGRQGIRVNAVLPGIVETGMVSDRLGKQTVKAKLEERIPLGRVGKAEDVAGVVEWLVSEGSRFVSGAEIVVDGGMAAGSCVW